MLDTVFAVQLKEMRSSFLTYLALLAISNLAIVSTQVILEVPGYAVLNGTTETSSFTERLFYAFRGVFYAEKPTPETRFLVISVLLLHLDHIKIFYKVDLLFHRSLTTNKHFKSHQSREPLFRWMRYKTPPQII